MTSNKKNLNFLKDYKCIVNHNFPIKKTMPQPNISKVISCAILPQKQQQLQNYQLHVDQQKKFLIMFDQRAFLKREFNQIIKKFKIDQFVKTQLNKSKYNLFIFPSSKQYETDELIMGSYRNQFKGILSSVINQYLNQGSKEQQILISIMTINQHFISDQLNFQWIQKDIQTPRSSNQIQKQLNPPNEPIPNILKKVPILKVHKDHQSIFIQSLNKHKIQSNQDLTTLLRHYNQLNQYLKINTNHHEINDKIGMIYQITVQQKGVNTKKLIILEIIKQFNDNQQIIHKNKIYHFNKNSPQILQMKLGMVLNHITTKKQYKNDKITSLVRDNKVLLALSECFENHIEVNKNFQISLITHVGQTYSIPQQKLNMNLDLQCFGKQYEYNKNYLDSLQILKIIKEKATTFICLSQKQKKSLIRQSYRRSLWKGKKQVIQSFDSTTPQMTKKLNEKIKTLQKSQRIRSKSYFNDTYSSFKKKQEKQKEQQIKRLIRNQFGYQQQKYKIYQKGIKNYIQL